MGLKPNDRATVVRVEDIDITSTDTMSGLPNTCEEHRYYVVVDRDKKKNREREGGRERERERERIAERHDRDKQRERPN